MVQIHTSRVDDRCEDGGCSFARRLPPTTSQIIKRE
jgi:hypothetical protein